MKLTDILNENKYSIIDPRGNTAGAGTKDQANGYEEKGKKKNESVNEAKFMDKNKKFKVYDKLKKGDKIRIKFGNSIRRDNEAVLVVSKGKTIVGKQKVERIILKNPANPNGVKYYLYNRDGNVSLAKGDMAAVIVDMIPESVNEDKFAGWIAIDHKGNKLEIKKSEAKDLYNAKLLAIKKLKVPKSKVGLLAIKPAVDESVINEAKYDIGMARKGNGITVYNRAEEENGDYKNVAHIDNKGKVKYYDKKVPSNIKKEIEAKAKEMMEVKIEGTMKLKDLLNESFEQMKVYSNPYHTPFVKENDDERREESSEMSNEQKQAFLEAVKAYKSFGKTVYRNEGLSDVYESIKGLVESAGRNMVKETEGSFDGITVSRHVKRMNESFRIFEKTLKEVGTLQQRLESTYDEIGEVLGKYYEINETEDDIEEGNEFGAARAKAIANGDSEFEVDGKKYPVKGVDKDDKENAKEFTKESMKLTDILKEGKGVGHYERVGNQTIVDSNFVNYSKGVLPNSELVHLGMGDFAIKSPKGMIKFERSGKLDGIGQDFVGRPHRMTDDKNGKLVELFLKLMLKKKKAILSMSESLVNESFGFGELPSEKLMKMKVSAKDMLDSVKESVNEARNKKVTKQMWRKMSDEKRFDALLSVVKDPDDAEKYVEFDWNDLPSGFERDMTLYEKN